MYVLLFGDVENWNQKWRYVRTGLVRKDTGEDLD